MKRSNDSPAGFRKQDLSVALVGVALVGVSAFDPGGSSVSAKLQWGLVVVGTMLAGWGLWNILIRKLPEEIAGTAGIVPDGFVERNRRTLLIVLFAVHVIATLFFISPRDVVNDRPVVTLDHAFHYYQAWRANHVFLHSARLHAYDPHFMAGFPSALFDIDVKALEAFCSVFPVGEVARAMKLFILGCYLSMVFTVYLGCRLLRLSERESILAVALGLVFWHWGRPYASHFRYAGMFGFICVSHLSILVVGLFQRFLDGKGVVWWLVLGPVVYFIHPTAVVILAVPYVSMILLQWKSLTLRKTAVFMAWCALVIVINSIWAIPLLEYASMKTPTRAFFQTSGAAALLRILFRPGCLPALALVALSVPGAWRMVRRGRSQQAATVLLTFAFLLGVAAYGVFLPGVKHLEPGRFLFSAILFAVPLAGAGAASFFDAWSGLSRRSSVLRFAEGAGVVVLVLSPVVLSFLSARTGYKHRVGTEFSAEVKQLVSIVEKSADPSGRLMIEDGPAALYDGVHLPGLLPAYTGVEQIGGPYPFTFLRHHFATFQRDSTMGRPLGDFSAREFWAYADLYNIRWVVTATAEARAFMARVASDTTSVPRLAIAPGSPPVASLWTSRRYALWRVERTPTFTGSDGDRVTAAFNRIDVNLAADRGSFLLRYHWDRGLSVDPPARVTPVREMDDPIPFMLVEPNGASSIRIRY